MPVVIVLITAIAVSLFVHFYQTVVNEAFLERSAAYVAAFANTTDAWLEEGAEEMVKTAARFLLVGSALYVQVVSGDAVLVDERIGAADSLHLIAPSVPVISRTVERCRLDHGPNYLDVIVPTEPLIAQDGSLEGGYVRIGLDATANDVRIRSMMLIASGIGLAFDLLVIGLFLWVLRGVWSPETTAKSNNRGEHGELAESVIIQLGALRIDQINKEVTLDGKYVSLTPKQYMLLHLLASDAKRVFSDKEILKAVWPDSSYADSKDVKQQVYLLRRRLEKVHPDATKIIVNVPGFGYKLVPPIVDDDLTEC